MKIKLVLLLVVVVFSLFAADKFVCVEYNRANDQLQQSIVVLTPQKVGDVKEGISFPYLLEKYSGAKVVADKEIKGSVTLEDVAFDFNSEDKKINFSIYLDEMNESSLTINSLKSGNFICH